jgi:hypothetical protein
MVPSLQSSAGEALSYVQGESLKDSAAVYGGFLLPGHQYAGGREADDAGERNEFRNEEAAASAVA